MRDTWNWVVICLMFAFYGCAAPPPPELMPAWPLPPEEPKIGYVTTHWGEADYANKRVFFDSIIGSAGASGRRLARPYGVVAEGPRIFVADSNGGVVMVFDDKDRTVSYIGDSDEGKLITPMGVAVGQNGSIFVSDVGLKRVNVYDSFGSLETTIGGKGKLVNPTGLAINDKSGRLYVVDSQAHDVKVFTTKGEFLFGFGKRGSGESEFNYPSNVAVDKRNGTVYICDTQNFRIQAFDQDGKFLRKFGQVGDRPGDFGRPKGIGIDSEGHVYVADAVFGHFQILDENGQVLLAVGSDRDVPGTLSSPAGLYVDAKDRIYVADAALRNVRIYQYLSSSWINDHPAEYKRYLEDGEKLVEKRKAARKSLRKPKPKGSDEKR